MFVSCASLCSETERGPHFNLFQCSIEPNAEVLGVWRERVCCPWSAWLAVPAAVGLPWACHGPAMGCHGLAWAGFCGRPACCDGRHYRSGRLSVAAVHRHSALRFRSFSSQWHRRARSFQPSLSTSALLTRSPNPLSQPSLRRLSCYLLASESGVGALAYPKTRLRPSPFKQGSGFAYQGHNFGPKIRVDQWRLELKTLGRCQLILRGGILDKSFARKTPSGSSPLVGKLILK